jgi:hypothetical protein
MIQENLIQEALCAINEVSNNSHMYMTGILLNDFDAQNFIKMLAHIQAIIVQSVQVNNPKRTLKYIVAFNRLLKSNNLLAYRLRNSITNYLLRPQ